MDVKQMTYILTIAQEGGISKAAAQLFPDGAAQPFYGLAWEGIGLIDYGNHRRFPLPQQLCPH